MDRSKQKLMKFVKFASDLSELSTCKAKKCSAVAFPIDFSAVLALGYNGPPIGQPNDSCTAPSLKESELARCGCIHAEANLTGKLPHLNERCVVYSTTMPCPHCAGLLANRRKHIGAVIWRDEYRTSQGLMTLRDAGILCPRLIEVVKDTFDMEYFFDQAR